MLVVKRKEGQAIVMDRGVRVVVLECMKGYVRLGIEAPDHVDIVREELLVSSPSS